MGLFDGADTGLCECCMAHWSPVARRGKLSERASKKPHGLYVYTVDTISERHAHASTWGLCLEH